MEKVIVISPRNTQVSPPARAFGLATGILVIMLAAGAVVYWQGRAVLVARIDEQIENEANHKGSLLEQAVAEAVARVGSLAAQPVMGRILDDDEDHAIAELLAVEVEHSSAITELTCFDSDGKAIASTNLTRLGTNAKSPIKQMPDGPRYALSQESGEEHIIVPIVRQFDELEQIGLLMAVIDRHVLLDELDAWWVGLISEFGEILVSGGQQPMAHVPAGAIQFTHPDLGSVRVVQMPLKMPEGAITRSWILAIAIPLANRYHPLLILGWMIGLTTVFASILVLGVVHHFSRQQRGLLRDLSDQCLRLEHATLEIEGQKEEAESMNVELTKANADLEAARVEATLATKAKSDFLANMSHEIRTPMTAILGFAENMLDAEQPDSERLSCVQTIRRNGEYLLGLINDILDLSKIEAGGITIECRGCQPCHIVAEVASLMRVRADAKGLPLSVEYIGAIPETIQSDATRLRQILINLLCNAIKFTETGAVRLVTRLVSEGGKPCLQFDVIDTGRGMTQEEAGRLFQAFMQADTSTTRKFGGTGLGLIISKRFAELLGGDVSVAETAMGAGSTFRVTVATCPLDGVKMLEDPMSATVVSDTATPAAQMARSDLQGLRILLAEDGPDNQRLISFVLQKAGADMTVKDNGKLALDAALSARDEGNPFDVILMDMQMPVMDGYEATGQLRQKGYTLPIIALTAHAMDSDRQKCIDAGCDDYATKPINRAKLITIIVTHLSNGETAMPSQENTHHTLVSELADEDMLELVEMFVGELPDKIAAIEKAIDEQDLATLATLAHQLKGSAGGYGFPTITDSAKGIEQGAKANADLETLKHQIGALADLCRRARASVPTG